MKNQERLRQRTQRDIKERRQRREAKGKMKQRRLYVEQTSTA
jgi:hypothetical protein